MTHMTKQLIFKEILLNFHIVNSLEIKRLIKKTRNPNKQTNNLILILLVQGLSTNICYAHTQAMCIAKSGAVRCVL